VYHDRTYAQVSVGDVEVELALETRGFEHQYELLEVLEEAGFSPKIRHGS
jgi:threonine dehydratase